MDFKELSEKANEYLDNKNYVKAAEYYKKCWDNYRNLCDERIGWGYAYSLRKLERFNEALDISREVYKMKPDYELNNNVYAWCIYYTEIKKDKIEDSSTFEKAAKGILELTKQDNKFSPYMNTIFKVLDYYKDPDFNAKKILEWTDILSPDVLSREADHFTSKDGKKRKMASDLERYYAIRSEALLKLEKYKECIELCNKALRTFFEFHYDNDVWFRRRIANSYSGLGEHDKALELFNSLLQQKKEWFIQKEISELYFRKQQYDNALQYAVDAALNTGDWDKKINLYILMADIFEARNQKELAKMHIELVISIKQQQDWKIKDTDTQQMKKYDIDANQRFDYKKLYNKLRTEWEKIKFKDRPKVRGVIKKKLPNNKAGFVRADDGNEYYFSARELEGKIDNYKDGDKVSFYIEEGFDKKKGKSSPVATKIKKDK